MHVPFTPVSCGVSLFVLSLALIWQNALSGPLYDSDAALFAVMAREMSATAVGTWMHMGGEWEWLFYEKPPLILWVEAVFMRILGPVPQAALLPTLIASTLTVFLVYKIGKRLVSREFGFLAAAILCLTPSFLKIARQPTIEPLLTFCLALTLYWGMGVRRSVMSALGAGLAFAAAFLAKGPPALAALPVLVGVHAFPSSDSISGESPKRWPARVPWGRVCLVAAVALGVLVLVDLWHYGLTGSSFWKRFYLQQLWPGVVTGREYERTRNLYFYFYYLWFLSTRYWPWLPLLLAGLILPWFRSKEAAERDALIRAWAFGLIQAGTIVLGFSLAVKRRIYYVYPYHIGLSVLAAIAAYALLVRRKEAYGYLVSAGMFAAAVIFCLASVFPPLFDLHPRPKLTAIIRLGKHLKRSGRKIDTIRLDCGRHGPWSLRRQAMFYLDVASYDCKTELEGIHLVDMRRDKSYARDGSRILAMSYPYVILDRGSEESSPNPAR